jgi:hypothetical protein
VIAYVANLVAPAITAASSRREDFKAEIRPHLATAESERLAAGVDRETAHYAALRDFGNVTLTTEAARRVWVPPWLEAVQDVTSNVRYAIRAAAKNPVALWATMTRDRPWRPRGATASHTFPTITDRWPDLVPAGTHGPERNGFAGAGDCVREHRRPGAGAWSVATRRTRCAADARCDVGRVRGARVSRTRPKLGAIGAALGFVAALGLARLLGSALYGVSATDGPSFGGALAIVLGGVIVATLVPPWRAARTNPLSALRHH